MRISALAAVLLMLVGVALLLHPSTPVVAQEPQALTPSPEPPTPTAIAPSATPPPTNTPLVTPTQPSQPPPPPPYPGPTTATPRAGREPEPSADLAVSKSVQPSIVLPGQLLTFTITLSNQAADPADNVVVTDTLPDVLSVYNATTTRGLISVSGQTVSVDIGRLEAGAEVVITIEALVSGAAPRSGYTNRVAVVTSSGDRNTGNNAAQASFAVGQQATAVPPTPTATIPATPAPGTPVPATPAPSDNCVRAAAGGEPTPTCTPVPPVHPTTPPVHPTAAATPRSLPDTGASAINAWGLMLVAVGALGLGFALRRRVTVK